MRQILMIGIGQTGSTVAEIFANKLNISGIRGSALAIDTDEGTLSEITIAKKLAMTDVCSLGSVVERLGEDEVSRYFPCDWENDCSAFAKRQEMRRGANLWRMKAVLSFNSFLSKEKGVTELHSVLDKIVDDCTEEDDIALYTVASLAGGTGSGLLLPVTLYIKRYLKEKGGKIALSRAFLAMPDIYKDVFTAERKIKCYSNAYAALRELNTIDMIAHSNEKVEIMRAHPPVEFKINLSCGKFQTLFDSDKEEFHTPSAAPFDKVTLFESIPTVNSVSEHVSVIADSVFFACTDEENAEHNSKATGTSIGSEAITRVCYPADSIVEYITNQQLLNFACKEIGYMGQLAEKHMCGRIMRAKNEHRRIKEAVEVYRDSYIAAVEDLLEKNGDFPEVLIGRAVDFRAKSGMPQNLYDCSWLTELDRFVEDSVRNESFEYLEKLICEYKNSETKKLSAAKAQEQVREIVEIVKKKLENAFYSAQLDLNEGKSDFIASITFCDRTAEFSFVNDILCENGKYLHPVYALFRLCIAHKRLETYKHGYTPVPDKPIQNYPFPIEILKVERLYRSGEEKLPNTKYYKYGENRFRDLLAFKYGEVFTSFEENPDTATVKKGKKLKNAATVIPDDYDTFFKDLETVCAALLYGIKHYRYLTVIEYLEVLIERYRNCIRSIDGKCDEIASEGMLALINGSSSNATVVKVGASEGEKKYLHCKYSEQYEADKQSVASNDMIIAEKFAALVCSDSATKTVRNVEIDALLGEISAVYRNHLVSSDFYKDNIDKNILGAIEDSTMGRFVETDASYSQIFASRYNPLKVCVGGYEREHVKSTPHVILSDGIAKAITDNPDRFGGKTAEKYVSDIISDYTEYGTDIQFSHTVNDKELFVCRRCEGYLISSVECVNEISFDSDGYTAYKKSLESIKTQQTPMWNPMLVYNRNSDSLLPFISPEMQDEYEKKIAKAAIYGFVDGHVSVSNHEKMGKVYFAKDMFDSFPLCLGDSPIKSGNVKDVMLWIYKHPDWAEKYANSYDGCVPSFDKLEAVMIKLLTALEKQDALDSNGYAKHIAEVVNDEFVKCLVNRSEKFSERAAAEYTRSVKRFFKGLEESLGAERATRYAKWLNSYGYFMDYSINNKFCEFKF